MLNNFKIFHSFKTYKIILFLLSFSFCFSFGMESGSDEEREIREATEFAQGAARILGGENPLMDGENFQQIAEFLERHHERIEQITNFTARATGEAVEAIARAFESERNEIENEIESIDRDILRNENIIRNFNRESNLYSKEYYEGDITRLKNKKDRLEEKIEQIKKDSEKTKQDFRDLTIGTADKFLKGWVSEKVQEKRLDEDRKNKIREGFVKIKTLVKSITEPENLKRIGIFICASYAIIVGLYYGYKLGYNYLDSKIGRPTLVRESTRHDWKHYIKNFCKETILGNKSEEISLDEVILPQDMTEKLKFLADDSRTTMENSLPFRHILFYGLPGTGKTMFAQRLAKYSGMDYAIMSGADFSQFKNGEDITEMHKLFDWAEQSKKGLLIFVDEADAFLRDRRVLNHEERNLVNAFLSRTGTNSEKFMLVFATNYEDELDPAVLSRIHKKQNFPLPGIEERIKIFNLYFDKYIRNDIREIEKDGQEFQLKINILQETEDENFIKEIAQKIDGFSGRDIEQMANELRVAAYNLGNGVLTKDIVLEVVNEKIEEHKHDVECEKHQRERGTKLAGSLK